jgi:hypothetical protein
VLAGLSLTVPFGLPWLPFLTAALAFAGWKAWTWWVRPSSRAVNLESKPAAQLLPGEWFRLYGSAGPVAEVEGVQPDPSGWLHVWVRGGRMLTLSPDSQVRPVKLRN